MKKQQMKAGLASAVLGILSPLAMLAPMANAATVTWTGTGDGGFNSALNWGGGVLVNGDTAVFPATGLYQQPNNDMSSLSLIKIIFNGQVTGSSSKSYTIGGNGLSLSEGIDAVMTGNGGDHEVGIDITLTGDAVFKTTGANTLTVGDDDTTLDLDDNDLTLQADGGTITLAGEIDGSGKIIKKGNGKVSMLAAPTNDFDGTTEVTEGDFVVTSTTKGNILINGGTLKGSSKLLGTVTMSAGKIAPGNSPGCLETSDLTLTGGSFDVEVNGTEACSGYDQISVEGTVNLGSNTDLNVSFGFEPETNTSFALILNDGTDAVQGTFKDFADGQKRTLGNYTYQVNYNGGDGNDVIMLVTGTPSAPDTGIGNILSNPFTTLTLALAVAGVAGGLKYADSKRK